MPPVPTPVTDEELLERLPGVRIDADNAAYWRGLLEHRLLLNRCRSCGHWHHPPRPVCPRCWSREIEAAPVSGQGVIDLFTVLHQGPRRPGVDYTEGHVVAGIGLVEQPGLRVAAAVVGTPAGEVRLGSSVRLEWQDVEGRPVPVFRVVDDAADPGSGNGAGQP